MSFSTTVKDELTRIEPDKDAIRVSQLAGMVRMDGTILIGAHKSVSLEIVSENASVARLAYSWLKDIFKVEATITIQRRKKLKKNNRYIVSIPTQRQMRSVLYSLGMMDESGMLFRAEIPEELIARDDLRRAYLRGVFLGGGSVNDPLRGYHLEIVTNSEIYAQAIQELIEVYGIEAKLSYRKENIIVYLKGSEDISDFLALIGAYESVMDFENIRINKNMRNRVNRLVNCETANLNKSIHAAQKQIQYINYIEEHMGIGRLPDTLRVVAETRLSDPEASLKELGDQMEPPVGKSGINHRMRRIEKIAQELAEKNGDVFNFG